MRGKYIFFVFWGRIGKVFREVHEDQRERGSGNVFNVEGLEEDLRQTFYVCVDIYIE